MKEVINIRQRPFCLEAALSWWRSKSNECKQGHFDYNLYLAILEARLRND